MTTDHLRSPRPLRSAAYKLIAPFMPCNDAPSLVHGSLKSAKVSSSALEAKDEKAVPQRDNQEMQNEDSQLPFGHNDS